MNVFLQMLRAIWTYTAIGVLNVAVFSRRYNIITMTAAMWFLGIFFVAGLILPPFVGYLGFHTLSNVIPTLAIFVCAGLGLIIAGRNTLFAFGIDVAEGVTPKSIRNNIDFLNHEKSLGVQAFKYSFLLGLWMLACLLIPATLQTWNNIGAYLGVMSCAILLTYYAAYNISNAATWTNRLAIGIGVLFAFHLGRLIAPGYEYYLMIATFVLTYMFLRDSIGRKKVFATDDSGTWYYVYEETRGKMRTAADWAVGIIAVLALVGYQFYGTAYRVRVANTDVQARQQQIADHEHRLRVQRNARRADLDRQIEAMDAKRLQYGGLSDADQAALDRLTTEREWIDDPDAQVAAKREAAERARIADLNRQIAALDAQIAVYDADLADIESQIEEVEARADSAGNLSTADEALLDTLIARQNRITELRDELIRQRESLRARLPGAPTSATGGTAIASVTPGPPGAVAGSINVRVPTTMPEPPGLSSWNGLLFLAVGVVLVLGVLPIFAEKK